MKPTMFLTKSCSRVFVTFWIWVMGSWLERVQPELQMACYVKGLCSLDPTIAAGSPLGKTGNDSTSQLPVQTENRDVSWQSPPLPSGPFSCSSSINVSHFLSLYWLYLHAGGREGLTAELWTGNVKLGIRDGHQSGRGNFWKRYECQLFAFLQRMAVPFEVASYTTSWIWFAFFKNISFLSPPVVGWIL